jgi:hypothetical protein
VSEIVEIESDRESFSGVNVRRIRALQIRLHVAETDWESDEIEKFDRENLANFASVLRLLSKREFT